MCRNNMELHDSQKVWLFWTNDQSCDRSSNERLRKSNGKYVNEMIKGQSQWSFKSNVSLYCWPGRLTFVMTWYSLYFRLKIWAERRSSQVMLLVVLQMACSISLYARRVMWGCSLAWMNSLHVCFLVLSLCIVWHCSQVPKLFPDGLMVPRLHCIQVHIF